MNRKKHGRQWVSLAGLSLGLAGVALGQSANQSTGPTSVNANNTTAVLQVPTTSSLFDPYYGSVQSMRALPEVLKLSLDEALKLGLENNLGLVYARQSEALQRSQKLQLLNVLLPNIDVQGSTAFHQFNLESEGFRPDFIAELAPVFAGLTGGGASSGTTSSFPLIIKVDVTQGQANLSQYLFNWAGYDVYRAYQHSEKAAQMNSSSSRGTVVLNVGTAYLRAVAAQSQVDYDLSLLKSDELVLYQSTEEHKAGTAANLDELRSRVQYQTQQQTVIADQNQLAKSKIALNRAIGLAPEQQIQLTEQAPFAELEAMSVEEATQKAMISRQDLQSLLEQLKMASYERKAATHERFPTLQVNGDYGVQGISGGVYHGVFSAIGTLSIPIFQEAKFRSDRDTADYQLQNLRSQIGDLRGQIDQQLRDSLIDLHTSEELVRVSRSNLDLANTELEQSIERFRAGIEDNLPTTQAQSTLAKAETQFVTSTFQYNEAKLGLARNLGIIDVDYKPEIRGGRPAGVLSDYAAEHPQGGR